MAQLKRSEIIAQAKIDAGRQAEAIALTSEFDFITKDMSKRANLLAEIATGSVVAAQNYIALPALYKETRELDVAGRRRHRYSNFKVGDNWLTRYIVNQDFYALDQTITGTPSLYMIEASPSIYKVYLYPMTATLTPAYEFYYWKFHEKAWPTWAGLTDKIDIVFDAATKTITSGAAEFVIDACRTGRTLTITGSVSNNNTFTIVSATTAVVVVAETVVDEGAGATVTIAVESENDYYHLYGENYDDVVIAGLAWKAAKKIKEREVGSTLFGIYLDGLIDQGKFVNQTSGGRTHYYHF